MSWLSILNGLKNRGVEDILIVCVADLKWVYTDPMEEMALAELDAFDEKWGGKYCIWL
mgnify:CR=1 FL=1